MSNELLLGKMSIIYSKLLLICPSKLCTFSFLTFMWIHIKCSRYQSSKPIFWWTFDSIPVQFGLLNSYSHISTLQSVWKFPLTELVRVLRFVESEFLCGNVCLELWSSSPNTTSAAKLVKQHCSVWTYLLTEFT